MDVGSGTKALRRRRMEWLYASRDRETAAGKVEAAKDTTRGRDYEERNGNAELWPGIRVRGVRRDPRKDWATKVYHSDIVGNEEKVNKKPGYTA